jgi:hypothetical protein
MLSLTLGFQLLQRSNSLAQNYQFFEQLTFGLIYVLHFGSRRANGQSLLDGKKNQFRLQHFRQRPPIPIRKLKVNFPVG